MPTVTDATRPNKCFYATVYDEPAQLVQVDGRIFVVTEDSIEPFEVEMAPFTCVLGEIGLCDTQHIMDMIVRRGYAAIACNRPQMEA
jgi:hypothetical protein